MATPSTVTTPPPLVEGPDISSIVTEDDTPVDNLYSEKQQRLLTEPLYSGWSGPPPDEAGAPRPFVAMANVGLFTTPKVPPMVPDVLVSLDVDFPPEIWMKEHRSYFIWEYGKVPDVVIEVVSNREGGELTDRKKRYRRMLVPYYIVWDPGGFLGTTVLHAFELRGHLYVRLKKLFFNGFGIGLTEWTGDYERAHERWLRWCDADGVVIPSGAERAATAQVRADAEHSRANAEQSRANAEQSRADAEHARAEQLAAKLRALGVDPG